MPFPEFDGHRKKLLFFCRGRGHGHAIPDIEIVRALEALRGDVEVRFVSYATGAQVLREFGFPVIDLGLPESNGVAETVMLSGRLIGWLQPDLVVSHEEFAALPAAKIFDIATACLLDWFAQPSLFSMQSLRFADSVLFLDKPGVFEEPPFLQGKVLYTGPVLRPLSWSPAGRLRAREELNIAPDATVVSVLPGSWREQKTPVLDLVAAAFELLKALPKHLVWIAGDDFDMIAERFAGQPAVTVIRYDWQLDRIIAAADLALTKATRGVLMHLEALGVRSLALSHGQNPMDEQRVRVSPVSRLLTVPELTPGNLAGEIAAALRQPRPEPQRGSDEAAGTVARELSRMLDGKSNQVYNCQYS